MALHHRLVRLFTLGVLGFAIFQSTAVHAYSYAGRKWINGSADYWLDIAGWDPLLIIYPAHTWNDAGSPFRFYYKGQNVYQPGDGMNTVGRYVLTSSQIAVSYVLPHDATWNSEVDTIFNMRYGWGCCGEPELYDVKNTMTHEFGHWLVLNDLTGWINRNKTMYYSSALGETKKQTLEPDDINGINYIY